MPYFPPINHCGVLSLFRRQFSAIHNFSRSNAYSPISSAKVVPLIRPFVNFKLYSTESENRILVKFITAEGDKVNVYGKEGQSILELAHDNEIELEGACEGSLACSTCHVILDNRTYQSLEEPSDDENDMLDLAFGLTETSRLGCQIKLNSSMNGMVVQLPSATRNIQLEKIKKEH